MIIELPGEPGERLGKRYKAGFFHFSNNNLAIRRQCAIDLGLYDPKALTSEDVDLCFRLALHPSWVACREPGVVIRHKARRTVRQLVRQMWGWGIRLGRAYRKTGLQGVFLYWVGSRTKTITRDVEINRGPQLVCVFATDFHMAHVLAFCAVIVLATGFPLVAAALGLLAAGYLWRYLGDVRRVRLGPWATLKLSVVHYLANVSFLTASFVGGLRSGMILIPIHTKRRTIICNYPYKFLVIIRPALVCKSIQRRLQHLFQS